ncbi:MAG: hypothetical protein ACE5EG_03770 [Thermoanaerobaculia bacterium]
MGDAQGMSELMETAAPDAAAETAAELEPVAEDALSSTVSGLSCPNCGGTLEVDAGLRVVECPFCQTPLLATSEIGVRRLAVEPQVDADKARSIARGWLAKGIAKNPKLKTAAEIGEAFLSFLPFYRVEADCVGFALGTEKRRRTTGSGKNRRTTTYYVDVERRVERSFDRTYPALNVAEWGIQRVDLRGDRLVPFDSDTLDRLGMVFPPTGSENDVRQAALERFEEIADPSTGLHSVRFKFLQTLRERLSVIYYPLWVVRYRFQNRSYQVLVDAEDGTLAYGKAPGNDFFRAAMLVLTQAISLFLGTTIIQVAASFEVLLFVGIPLIAALAWGWHKFRYGGVVIEGSGAKKEADVGMAVKALTDRGRREELVRDLMAGKAPEIFG